MSMKNEIRIIAVESYTEDEFYLPGRIEITRRDARSREYDIAHLGRDGISRLERGVRMARALLSRRFAAQPVAIDGTPITHRASWYDAWE